MMGAAIFAGCYLGIWAEPTATLSELRRADAPQAGVRQQGAVTAFHAVGGGSVLPPTRAGPWAPSWCRRSRPSSPRGLTWCASCVFLGACLHLSHCGTPLGKPHIGEPPPPPPPFFRTPLFLLPPVSYQPSAPPHRPLPAASGAAAAAAVTSGDGLAAQLGV